MKNLTRYPLGHTDPNEIWNEIVEKSKNFKRINHKIRRRRNYVKTQ